VCELTVDLSEPDRSLRLEEQDGPVEAGQPGANEPNDGGKIAADQSPGSDSGELDGRRVGPVGSPQDGRIAGS
jgi:hypothetical protein